MLHKFVHQYIANTLLQAHPDKFQTHSRVVNDFQSLSITETKTNSATYSDMACVNGTCQTAFQGLAATETRREIARLL